MISEPAGTLGWVPHELTDIDAISPGNTMLTAQAVASPARQGIGRFFIIHLTAARTRPAAVPQSAAPVNAITAWSANGSWLFYQGHGERLQALQVATAKVKSFTAPCCNYGAELGAMLTLPSSP
jgi:hypothetical protein